MEGNLERRNGMGRKKTMKEISVSGEEKRMVLRKTPTYIEGLDEILNGGFLLGGIPL